jgi:hypothetical protein
MNEKKHNAISHMISELLYAVTETEIDRLRVLQKLIIASILANSTSKEHATDMVAELAASCLNICEFWSKNEDCHWRQDGETVQ